MRIEQNSILHNRGGANALSFGIIAQYLWRRPRII